MRIFDVVRVYEASKANNLREKKGQSSGEIVPQKKIALPFQKKRCLLCLEANFFQLGPHEVNG